MTTFLGTPITATASSSHSTTADPREVASGGLPGPAPVSNTSPAPESFRRTGRAG